MVLEIWRAIEILEIWFNVDCRFIGFSIGNSLISKCTNLFVTNLNLLVNWCVIPRCRYEIFLVFMLVSLRTYYFLNDYAGALVFCWFLCFLFFSVYCRYSHLTRALSTPLDCILNCLLGLELSYFTVKCFEIFLNNNTHSTQHDDTVNVATTTIASRRMYNIYMRLGSIVSVVLLHSTVRRPFQSHPFRRSHI